MGVCARNPFSVHPGEVNIIIHGIVPYYEERIPPSACPVAFLSCRETDDGHVRRIIRCGNKKSSPSGARYGVERHRRGRGEGGRGRDVQTSWQRCDDGKSNYLHCRVISKSTWFYTWFSTWNVRIIISRANKISHQSIIRRFSIFLEIFCRPTWYFLPLIHTLQIKNIAISKNSKIINHLITKDTYKTKNHI